jgi:phenylacetate-CoA ligase
MTTVSDVVAAARARVPFYRDRLSGHDDSPLEVLPSFDKAATAAYGRFPLSAGGAPGAYRVVATSGTTGDRMCVSFDRTDWERVGAWLEGVGQRAGLRADDVLLNTHCYGLWVGGPVLDLLAQRAGAGVVPLGPVEATGVLQFLGDGVGSAISATPSYMRRLVEAAEGSGVDLASSPLRLGFIGAEPAEQAIREKIGQHLPEGFRWVELYGLTETLGPSVACAPDPDLPELEVNRGDYHVEVLDVATDQPVPSGEVGDLTLTTRDPACRTPLVRYRTRDLVRITAGDAAGPRRISRILGRADDSLKVGGVLVYPSAVAEVVSAQLPASAEWQAVIRRDGEDDELLIEAEATPDDCVSIARAFQQRVGLGVEVKAVEAGSMRRSFEKTRRILVGSAPGVASSRPVYLGEGG